MPAAESAHLAVHSAAQRVAVAEEARLPVQREPAAALWAAQAALKAVQPEAAQEPAALARLEAEVVVAEAA